MYVYNFYQKMRYHFASLRMAIIKKKNCWSIREETHGSWWDCKMVHTFWNNLWQFLKKLNIVLPCDWVILLIGEK